LNSFYLVFISLVDLFFGDSVTLAQILKPSDTIKPTSHGLQTPSLSQTANDRSTFSISRAANNSSFQSSSTAVPNEPRTTMSSAILKMLPSSGDWLRQIVFTVHDREQKGFPR
jgi:hypothetical protein